MTKEEKEILTQGYLFKLLSMLNRMKDKVNNYKELKQVFYDCIDIINKIEELENK